VRIDWNGLARARARLTVRARDRRLTPAPEGHSVALTVGAGRAAAAARAGGRRRRRHVIINVESGQLTRVPPAPQVERRRAAGARRAAAVRRRRDMVFARDGRTLYFRSGTNLFAAPINLNRRGRRRRGGGRRRWARRRGRAPARPGAAADTGTNATARHVTYTVNLEVDHKALRAQVFNEGWRIMKNRFYDAKMHGAELERGEEMYEPLLESSSTRKSCTRS
jgi:hypothetical protein